MLQRFWLEWRGFVVFVAIMLVFRSAVADWNQVPSGSMLPSILIGDRIVVNKIAYDLRIPFTLERIAQWEHPQRGDVVTFGSPEDEKLLVKRVIGVPGDRIEMVDNRLVVNGEPAGYTKTDANDLPGVTGLDLSRFDVYLESSHGNSRYVMHDKRIASYGYRSFDAVTVPADNYLMLGDNRDHSQDSRVIGFVERHRILGRAGSVAFSLNHDNYYVPRRERFFEALP